MKKPTKKAAKPSEYPKFIFSRKGILELRERVRKLEENEREYKKARAAEVRLTNEEMLSLRFFIAAIRGVHDGTGGFR